MSCNNTLEDLCVAPGTSTSAKVLAIVLLIALVVLSFADCIYQAWSEKGFEDVEDEETGLTWTQNYGRVTVRSANPEDSKRPFVNFGPIEWGIQGKDFQPGQT